MNAKGISTRKPIARPGEKKRGLDLTRECLNLFITLPDPLCILDEKGEILACNEAFAKAYATQPEALQGGKLYDLLPPALALACKSRVKEAFQNENALTFEDEHNAKWYEHRLFPIPDKSGNIHQVALLTRDITQKHKIEAERLLDQEFTQERERYYSTLLANLPGMAYRCSKDPGWPMVFASEGALQLTGHPAEDFTKQNPFLYAELIHPDDRMMVWNRVQDGLKQRTPFTLEYRIIDANGTEKWVWERGRRVTLPPKDSPVLEGFILDISTRKMLERLTEENAQKEIELLKARKSESLACLAGAVAHHFNNKFQTIFGCLELADSHLLAINGQINPVREELRASLHAAMEAAQVSQKMMTYLGKSMAEQIRVEILALCQEILQRPLPSGRLDAKLPKKPLWTLANPEELRDVIGQLVTNALEAKPAGEVKLTLRKTHRENSQEEWACLEVADQGPGVPPHLREQIFDPFFSTKFAGRGLGLAMVRGTVHKIGGEVDVMDAPGGGALFRVWLPLDSP